MVEERERPAGITLLAVLGFLTAGLGVLFGLLLIVGGGVINSFFGNQIAAQEFAIFAGAGVILLIFALIGLAIAWGLWTGKSWAWWIEVILSALGLLSILSMNLRGLVDAAIAALILWYMFKPHVKEFFGVQVSFST